MESEKAELEAKLKVKRGSRPEEPTKKSGGWYAVFFLVSMLCFLGSYLAPSPEEARPMRLMGGALFVAGTSRKGIFHASETIGALPGLAATDQEAQE